VRKLFLACLLFSVSVFADEAEHRGDLSGKVVIQSDFGYFLLSDGSYWKVYSFAIRSRGFFEWIRGIQLLTPENCDCKADDWVLGSSVEAYPKSGTYIDLSDADNIDALKNCTHFLVNTNTGKILFCIPLLPADCMTQIYQDAARLAFSKGYQAGFSAAESAVRLHISNAYNQGFSAGYAAGLSVCAK